VTPRRSRPLLRGGWPTTVEGLTRRAVTAGRPWARATISPPARPGAGIAGEQHGYVEPRPAGLLERDPRGPPVRGGDRADDRQAPGRPRRSRPHGRPHRRLARRKRLEQLRGEGPPAAPGRCSPRRDRRCRPRIPVATWIQPPAGLCRNALSTRLATMLSSSHAVAGDRRVPEAARLPARSERARPGSPARPRPGASSASTARSVVLPGEHPPVAAGQRQQRPRSGRSSSPNRCCCRRSAREVCGAVTQGPGGLRRRDGTPGRPVPAAGQRGGRGARSHAAAGAAGAPASARTGPAVGGAAPGRMNETPSPAAAHGQGPPRRCPSATAARPAQARPPPTTAGSASQRPRRRRVRISSADLLLDGGVQRQLAEHLPEGGDEARPPGPPRARSTPRTVP